MIKKLAVFLFALIVSSAAHASGVNNYDQICKKQIEGRGVVEIAEKTSYIDEDKVLIIEFNGVAVMISADQDMEQLIKDELARGFDPIGVIVMSGGEEAFGFVTATRTNDDGDALGCSTTLLMERLSKKFEGAI